LSYFLAHFGPVTVSFRPKTIKHEYVCVGTNPLTFGIFTLCSATNGPNEDSTAPPPRIPEIVDRPARRWSSQVRRTRLAEGLPQAAEGFGGL
jgi:hypothetical protein